MVPATTRCSEITLRLLLSNPISPENGARRRHLIALVTEGSTAFLARQMEPSAASVRLQSRRRLGQREIERRPSADGALCPNLAVMAFNDALHDGQSNAGAFKLALVVQSLKYAEELLRIRHVEAGSVVPNEVRRALSFPRSSELDRCLGGL